MRSCSGARWPWSLQVLRQSHRDQSSNDISHVAQGPTLARAGKKGNESLAGKDFCNVQIIQRQKVLCYIDMNCVFLAEVVVASKLLKGTFFQTSWMLGAIFV